jgi:GT2 family glycosyltransferase
MDDEQVAREIERLRREVRSLQRTVERQNAANQQFARRVEDLTRNTEDIVQSRIWRSLCAVGAPLLGASKWLPRRRRLTDKPSDAAYQRWIERCERPPRTPAEVDRLTAKPLISVLVRGGGKKFGAAQVYPNYEVVTGLEAAKGEYVCFVDAGDQLSPDALAAIAECRADVIYCDEDEVDSGGRRSSPFFKPDWSPDLLLSTNYIRRPLAVRTKMVHGTNDYALLLRLMADHATFARIPEVLYHRSARRPQSDASERETLERHLERASPGAYVQAGPARGYFRVRYPIAEGNRVSIIIPSGGNREMLERSLEGIARNTDYADYEIVIIDNSRGNEIKTLADFHDVRCIDWRGRPFNFSEICNRAAGQCDSALLLFLNDDTEPLTPGWLRAMVELAARPEVGVVGAKLLFPDGTIQHAGVVLGLFGRSGHAFKHLPDGAPNYFHFADIIRDVSAVTGACLMIRAGLFREVGGFDEVNFPVDSNDIDLCLRVRQAGFRVVYTPYALLRHYEAVSKSPADLRAHPNEIAAFHQRWKEQIENDPFYNPNLTRDAEDFSIKQS